MSHDPKNNSCPRNADQRNETCSCEEAPERGGSEENETTDNYDALLQPTENRCKLDCGCILERMFGDGSVALTFCERHQKESDQMPSSASSDSVQLIPHGYEKPGGAQRIKKAEDAFYETKCAVSNLFTQLLKELYGSNYQVAAKAFAKRINQRGERLCVDPEHLATLLQNEADAQEEVLRAISGNPPMRKRTDPEPVCTIVDA